MVVHDCMHASNGGIPREKQPYPRKCFLHEHILSRPRYLQMSRFINRVSLFLFPENRLYSQLALFLNQAADVVTEGTRGQTVMSSGALS